MKTKSATARAVQGACLLAAGVVGLYGCANTPPAPPPRLDVETQAPQLRREVQLALHKYVRYPAPEFEKGVEGYVVVVILIDQSGMVSQASLLRPSGDPSFDAAATDAWPRMMQDNVRFPAYSSSGPSRLRLAMEVPVLFCADGNPTCTARDALHAAEAEANAQLAQAAAAFDAKQFTQARQLAARSAAALPSLSAMMLGARAAFALGDYAAVQSLTTAMIALAPVDEFAFDLRARAEYAQHQYAQAAADAGSAVAISPELTHAYQIHGRASFQLGHAEDALSDFTRVVAMTPSDSDAYRERAWVYHRLGRDHEALSDANQAVQLGPMKAAAYNTRAHILESLSDRQHATADYQQALVLDSGVASAREGLGRIRADSDEP